MRILLLIEAFRSIGGIEEVVDNLAVELMKAGHTAAVVSTPCVPAGCERTPRAQVECIYLEICGRKPVTLRHPERLFRRPRGVDELAAVIRRWKPDVVSSHECEWDKFPTIAEACTAVRVPLVQSLYDWRGCGKLGNSALRVLDGAAALTALSNATRRHFERLLPGARRARVITGGVDWEAARQAALFHRERPYILSAARLDLRSKALDVLISAFRALAGSFPDVDLLIAGAGPDRDQLEALAASSGLSGRVEFLGVRPREELWSVHKGARLFVLPSHQPEGLGLVFLEAMACGVPVVGSRSGGTPEIIAHGECGSLLDENDPGALASLMAGLLADPGARARMGARGRELAASRYGWQQMAASYLEVFSSCLGARA